MPATGNTATRGKIKVLIAALLLIGLMVGLAACRGFFGQAPIALLVVTAPTNDQEVPVTVTFDISGSTDPDGTIATYDLDYGDGSTHATGTVVPTTTFTYEYTEDGTYTVTLTVTDSDGRTDKDTDTVTIGPAMVTFASDRGGDYDIWRMHADGTDAGIVLNTAADELFPDLVKGTRDTIAYTAEDGISWNIWTMTINGQSAYQLTMQTASNQIEPSWSYQGTKIAYASNAAQTPSASTWEIWTMTASGGSQAKLTAQSPSWAIAPAYSPISDDMVFVSGVKHNGTATAGGSAIIKRTAAGVLTTLYDSTGNDGDASPASFPTGLATALNLPTNAGISKPAWSPDGTKIAFSTDKDTAINIYVMDAAGTGVQTLEAYVNSLVSSSVTAGSITSGDDEFSPYWLEDETGLVFAREETTGYNIYKVSFADGSVTKLTNTTDNDIMPAAKR